MVTLNSQSMQSSGHGGGSRHKTMLKAVVLLVGVSILRSIIMSSHHAKKWLCGCETAEDVKQLQRELEYSKQTINRLKEDIRVLQGGGPVSGCSPGSLHKFHKHIDQIMKVFERQSRDHDDDIKKGKENAEQIKGLCSDPKATQLLDEIIHTYRYRKEPDYGIPLGRKKSWSGEGEYGMDKIVEPFVTVDRNDNQRGMYLELGGFNGVAGNTHLFDDVYGWDGLMLEAGMGNYQYGKKHRPNPQWYRVAMWNQTGKLVTAGTLQEMSSDLSNTNAGAGLIAGCAKLAKGEKSPGEMDVQAPCHTIKHVLSGKPPFKKRYGDFDYVSLDCEGCEIHVVEHWDFDENPSKVFTIENHEQVTPPDKWRRIVEIMRLNGYVWLFDFYDSYFINTRLLYGIEPDAFNLRKYTNRVKISWVH